MKIGPKIALFYSLITMCAIIMVMSVFYLFSSRYINRLYESYLREKAFITAQKYWEKDEVDEQSYRLIQQKYDELLPQAREVLLNMDTLAHVKDTLGKYLNASQQERLFHGDGTPVTFKYKKELGAALYYPDNEGYFIVFVFSENTYGKEIQEHILLLSVTLVVISSIFIFFIGRVYSNRILTPLQHILKELKRIRANNLNVRLRSYGNKDELDQLNKEVDRIAYTTHFNQQYMLAEGTPQAAPGYYRIQSGALNGQAIDIHFVNASKESLGTDKVNVS